MLSNIRQLCRKMKALTLLFLVFVSVTCLLAAQVCAKKINYLIELYIV